MSSAGSRGVNPDRDAKGGPNKALVVVTVTPAEVDDVPQGHHAAELVPTSAPMHIRHAPFLARRSAARRGVARPHGRRPQPRHPAAAAVLSAVLRSSALRHAARWRSSTRPGRPLLRRHGWHARAAARRASRSSTRSSRCCSIPGSRTGRRTARRPSCRTRSSSSLVASAASMFVFPNFELPDRLGDRRGRRRLRAAGHARQRVRRASRSRSRSRSASATGLRSADSRASSPR